MMRALCKQFWVAGLMAAWFSAPALAQNYDAAHQVRSGIFGQWGLIRGDGVRAGLTDDFTFSSLGVGFTSGIEYVRKHSWSYGIEVDGAVLSGEETIAPGETSTFRYRQNLSASLRVRAGRHVRPELYWYGTLGLAMVGAEMKTATEKFTYVNGGVVLGTGLERDFGPGLFFAEYLYTRYGHKDFERPGLEIDSASHMFRVGVKYKLGHDHYADDVVERIGERLRRER